MGKPKVTKMVAGKEEEVPIEQVWDSICKVIRLARVLTSRDPEGDKYREARIAFLKERLEDLEMLEFHYKERGIA